MTFLVCSDPEEATAIADSFFASPIYRGSNNSDAVGISCHFTFCVVCVKVIHNQGCAAMPANDADDGEDHQMRAGAPEANLDVDGSGDHVDFFSKLRSYDH